MAATETTDKPDKVFLGREASAVTISVSTRTLDDAIRAGELEAFRVGRRVLIPRDALIAFVKRVRAS